jgi:hypothetical protein
VTKPTLSDEVAGVIAKHMNCDMLTCPPDGCGCRAASLTMRDKFRVSRRKEPVPRMRKDYARMTPEKHRLLVELLEDERNTYSAIARAIGYSETWLPKLAAKLGYRRR